MTPVMVYLLPNCRCDGSRRSRLLQFCKPLARDSNATNQRKQTYLHHSSSSIFALHWTKTMAKFEKSSDFARLDQGIATPASIVHPWLKWLSAIVHQQKCQKTSTKQGFLGCAMGTNPSFHEVKKSTVGPVELASPSQNHSWRFPILGMFPILAPVKPTTGDHKASVRNGLQIKPCWLTTHIWLI